MGAEDVQPEEIQQEEAQPEEAQPDEVQKSYGERLFSYANLTAQDDYFYSLTFGVLHRLNIMNLHNELAKIKSDLYHNKNASDENLELLKVTLRDYGIAQSTPSKYTGFSSG
jgi:hypothetical protein